MTAERTAYADSILTTKSPSEATEVIRIRLSQAKLINKEFYLLFNEVSQLKRSYAQQLRKIITENEDLNKLLKQQMVENKVLSTQEMSQFNFESLGELQSVWDTIVMGLKEDMKATTEFYHTVDNEVIRELQRSTENDTKWSESKKLHSKLSQIAAAVDSHQSNHNSNTKLEEANKQWDSEVPYLFELFENIDFNRLETLKNTSIRYQTAVSDYLLNYSKKSEVSMTKLLEFDSQKEINRFARESSRYKFEALPTQKLEDHKTKRKSTFGNRFTSGSSVLHHDLMNQDFSDSNNNSSLGNKKSTNKLKSKMGSIFSRNKLKNKRSTIFNKDVGSPLVEGEITHSSTRDRSSTKTSSTSQPQSPIPSETHDQTARRRSTIQSSRESDSLYRAVNRTSTAQSFQSGTPIGASETDHEENSPRPETPQKLDSQRDMSRTPLSMSQPPLQPQLKTKALPSEPPQSASPERNILPTQQNYQQGQVDAKALHIRAPALPPSRKHTTNIKNSEPLSSPEASPGNGTSMQKDAPQLTSQITGSLTMLNPQTTGSSASLIGQNVFQHSYLEVPDFGLSASIAEVINATFKDGILKDSQLIGEIAFSYMTNAALNTPLPIGINLRIDNAANLSKVILNQAFVERVDIENFKVSPQFINSRTLGAIKYSMKEPTAPIVIHPVWRFEATQASVVLTIKMSPTVSNQTKQIILDDLTVLVSIQGANATSALSKPQGSFSKEKKRIAWRFKGPTVLNRDGEQRLIARFLTDGPAQETENGVITKFTIRDQSKGEVGIGSDISIKYQELDENDPFGGPWNDVISTRTITAGNYNGLS
ncbi:hypothetical protein HG535_0B05820 [Zygotorulaspora mrakii]|uniref:MHD domain-containing protein n=1 Tax=Zygotorulaspora mrakii TaxID=42260 RepID=A0A7H9AYQ1_ZYGMR|nr:uncharacterized protein HG535_0B05820 [Zygotorulaspora mrakii]QLG71538.1 hypothetical protein HG535_0B05820 [Zygotorulaspora mrakii]